MKLMKAVLLNGVVVAAGLLAFALAVPVHGQGRDRAAFPRFEIFEGPGSRIGATARELDAADMERLKVTGGVLLDSVTPDGPAAKAGMRGQDVVVEFDGERVRSVRQFTRLVRETPSNRSVRAVVLRDGKRTELSVTPADAESVEASIDADRIRRQVEEMTGRMRSFEGFELPFLWPTRLGVTVHELTPELAAYFGASDGVLVASVTADSPAAKSGIKAGDVITSIDGRDVTSAADLTRALRNRTSDAEVTIGIVRDKKPMSVMATIEPPSDRRTRAPRQPRPVRLPI
jgi:serine protease Do